MGKLNIKNGTPVGSENLCLRCNWSQCMTGFRESDRLVICNKTNPNIEVPFVVLECTGYDDKFRPDWSQMQKLAIDIQPVRVSSRTAGFSALSEARPVTVPAEDEDEVAARLNRRAGGLAGQRLGLYFPKALRRPGALFFVPMPRSQS